jgi:trimeric autotransporter adhesin
MKTQGLRTFRSALIVATLLLALSSLGLTRNTVNSTGISVPHLIKLSGVVKDGAGAPQTGVVGVTFAFYKDQQGGTPLWLETQNAQADASGRYTVMLGATKSDGLPMAPGAPSKHDVAEISAAK